MWSSISAAHAFNIHLHGLVVRRVIFQVPGKARSGQSFLILSTKGTCVPLSSFLCLALTLNLFTYINISIFSCFSGARESKVSRFELFNPEHQWHLCPSVLFPVFAFNFNFFTYLSLLFIFSTCRGKKGQDRAF